MTLPEPPIPYGLDLRAYNLPMPMNAKAIKSSDWVLLSDTVRSVRLQLMAWAWDNNPTGSLPNCPGLCRIVNLSKRAWNKHGAAALTDFVLCSDDRLYHPGLVDCAKVAWAHIEAAKARSLNGRLNVRSQEWKLLRAGVFARDNYTCHYCETSGEKLECDHVIPVSRGGSNDASNLVTACKSCNRSKGSKRLEDWLQ